MYMPLLLGFTVAAWGSLSCGMVLWCLQVQVHRLLGAPWRLLSRILLLHRDLAHLGSNTELRKSHNIVLRPRTSTCTTPGTARSSALLRF